MLSQPKLKEVQKNYAPEEVNTEPRTIELQKQLMDSSMTTPKNPYPPFFNLTELHKNLPLSILFFILLYVP
ncbi:hypothetical protein DSO57_1032386 [Entomophthora muscae]|uniref:Uncharacterized protein n=1 Tax=Entomophthora muscae TaxID=34485 RepID=A0ACC2S2P1_9FUNG|nr:hypothetical protein DSO57_1032386 [Entomophthora muscae]